MSALCPSGDVKLVVDANDEAIFQAQSIEPYKSSNVSRVLVVAQAVPTCVLFDVQPKEFKPETNLTLTANVSNAVTHQALNCTVMFCAVYSDGQKVSIGTANTNENGIATLQYQYPDALGALALVAEAGGGQPFISSPVMLTVGKETAFELNVTRTGVGYEHRISGRLLSDGDPVIFRTVKILVNDVVKGTLLTSELFGNFSLGLDLPAVGNNSTTYNIQALFEGDETSNATYYGKAPDGTEHVDNATVQFGFKPTCKAVSVIIEPSATGMLSADKTPEEMQQEAENNGWLKVWGEPTGIWPPWWMLHFNVTIGSSAWIHVAFNPAIPFWPGIAEFHGLETLLPALPSTPQPPTPPDETSRILQGIISTIVRNLLALGAIAAGTAIIAPLPATFLAMGIYSLGCGWMLVEAAQTYYSSEWGAHTKAYSKLMSLLVAFSAAAVAVELSFSAGAVFKSIVVSALSAFLINLINPFSLEAAVTSVGYSMWIGMVAALAALRIPNPLLSNVYFRPSFLIVNLAFAALTIATAVGISL